MIMINSVLNQLISLFFIKILTVRILFKLIYLLFLTNMLRLEYFKTNKYQEDNQWQLKKDVHSSGSL